MGKKHDRSADMEIMDGVLIRYRGNDRAIRVPDGVRRIGEGAFFDCLSAEEIFLPDSVMEIRDEAFAGCSSLESIRLPEKMDSIGREAFSSCYSLWEIRLPAGLSVLKEETFSQCVNLSEIRIPEGVSVIEEKAFLSCQALKRAVLPGSLRSIGKEAFRGCVSLQEIRIPDRVRRIGDWAFYGCEELAAADLPSGMDDLSLYAFRRCFRLKAFQVRGSEGPLMEEDGILYDRDKKALLIYPYGRKEDPYRVPAWIRTIDVQSLYPDIGRLGWKRPVFRTVILPEGLERIGDSFYGEETAGRSIPYGIEYMRLPDSLSGSGGGSLCVTHTGSSDPGQAVRGDRPVYFGDPHDLPESRRTKACLGFFYALDEDIPEILPWREAYEAFMREDPLPLVRLAGEDRSLLFHLIRMSLLPEEGARDLLETWGKKEDIEVRAVLIEYLKRFAGGSGALSLEDL